MNDALFTEKYENYLLVEGRDDKHVFYELLKQHQILKQFETKNQYFEVKDAERAGHIARFGYYQALC